MVRHEVFSLFYMNHLYTIQSCILSYKDGTYKRLKKLRDEGCKMYKSHLLVDFWTSSVSCRMTAISGFRLSKHKEIYAFFSLSKSAVMNAVFFLFLESGSISSIPVFLLTNDNSGRHPKSSFRLH